MANYLYRGDLPDGLDLGPVVAIDSETMGLQPGRDRLCLVQLSGGDGNAHLVQILPGQRTRAEPRAAARRPGHAEALPLRPLRHRRAAQPLRRADPAGLLHQDRLAAGAHLHRPPRAQGPACASCSRSTSPSSSSRATGAPPSSRRRSSTMRPRTSSISTACATRSTPRLAREGRTDLARACFDFLPDRARLDLAGWDEIDIFAHS